MANLTYLVERSYLKLPITISSYEAVFMALYTLVALITGLVGNLFVFVASYKYHSFDVDIITVLFIRNVAVADFLHLLTAILPWSVTSVAKRWVFGDAVCYVEGLLHTFVGVVSTGFLIAVAAHRFGRCVAPMSLSCLTVKKAHCVAIGIWVFGILQPVMVAKNKRPIIFDPTVTFCMPVFLLDTSKVIFPVQLVYVWTPFVLMFGLNIAILIVARRSTRRLSVVAIQTVCSICGVYLISWVIPLCRIIFFSSGCSDQSFLMLNRVGQYLFTFAAFSNPLLYTVTNVRFRRFVVKYLKGSVCVWCVRKVTNKKRFAAQLNCSKDKPELISSKDIYQRDTACSSEPCTNSTNNTVFRNFTVMCEGSEKKISSPGHGIYTGPESVKSEGLIAPELSDHSDSTCHVVHFTVIHKDSDNTNNIDSSAEGSGSCHIRGCCCERMLVEKKKEEVITPEPLTFRPDVTENNPSCYVVHKLSDETDNMYIVNSTPHVVQVHKMQVDKGILPYKEEQQELVTYSKEPQRV